MRSIVPFWKSSESAMHPPMSRVVIPSEAPVIPSEALSSRAKRCHHERSEGSAFAFPARPLEVLLVHIQNFYGCCQLGGVGRTAYRSSDVRLVSTICPVST